jgi:3-deoxy-D-manno-octulosonic-acid transferase
LVTRRSEALPTAATAVWLGDSMGEMVAYYAAADLALIGGSLQPLGGQNLIEAAACGCPTLLGPHMFNFAQASRDAQEAGAARQLPDRPPTEQVAPLADAVTALLSNPAALAAMRQAAHDFAAAHQGATARTLAAITPFIPG